MLAQSSMTVCARAGAAAAGSNQSNTTKVESLATLKGCIAPSAAMNVLPFLDFVVPDANYSTQVAAVCVKLTSHLLAAPCPPRELPHSRGKRQRDGHQGWQAGNRRGDGEAEELGAVGQGRPGRHAQSC